MIVWEVQRFVCHARQLTCTAITGPWAAGSDQLSNRSSSGQLLAVTEWGIVSLWTVMVLPATAQSADADVGLRTGSWTCLLLTATLTAGSALHPHLSALALDNASQLCMEVGRHAAALAIPANSSDQFLVGMDSTQVLRGSLYGNLYLPKVGIQHSACLVHCCKQCWCRLTVASALSLRTLPQVEGKLHQVNCNDDLVSA